MTSSSLRDASSVTALLATDPEAPPELVALVLARDADPSLDVAAWMRHLDELAEPLRARIRRGMSASEQAATLGTYFRDDLGFRGNDEDYYDPRNSYLHAVVETRRGIPITLAVVFIAIGRRAGLDVVGVGFPGHFLARVGGASGALVDPFFGARFVTAPVLDELARRALGAADRMRPEHLASVDSRAIAVRMLHNLKAVFEARRDAPHALLVCDRLVDLTGQPELRRDRARHALTLGAQAAALEDFDAYLAARSDAADADAIRAQAAQLRARSGGRQLQ